MTERTYGGHTLAQIKSNGFEEVGSDEFRDLIAAAEELELLKISNAELTAELDELKSKHGQAKDI